MSSNPVAVLRRWTSTSTGASGQHLLVWCPGCAAANADRGLHAVEVAAAAPPPVWTWDGNLDAPTISPSILVSGPPMDPQDILRQPGVCHSYIRAGRWEYLGDCTHALVGQTVNLPPLPDWICRVSPNADPWECGECHVLTSESHFYEDRATGKMAHMADSAKRDLAAGRCGWSFYDDYEAPTRCVLPWDHDAYADPRIHTTGRIRFTENQSSGAIPPAAPRHDGGDQ